MSDYYDEDQVLKNRIILRESTIRKLTSKYLDLISKFNTLTRNEMALLIKEIINEIDLIEIAILKAENLDKLKNIDSNNHRRMAVEIESSVSEINLEITNCSKRLIEAKTEKEYKINCEEVAKIINGYEKKERLEESILKLEEDNLIVENTEKLIMDKLNTKSGKLSLLVKLIDDLKSNFEEDIECLNRLSKDKYKMKSDL